MAASASSTSVNSVPAAVGVSAVAVAEKVAWPILKEDYELKDVIGK